RRHSGDSDYVYRRHRFAFLPRAWRAGVRCLRTLLGPVRRCARTWQGRAHARPVVLRGPGVSVSLDQGARRSGSHRALNYAGAMSRPWESDRPLTLEVARAAIKENFLTIDTRNLEYIGCGWDYDVYATSDGWAFRFPGRAHCADVFEWEQRIHDLAARALPRDIAVPRVELIGQPGGGFPYR